MVAARYVKEVGGLQDKVQRLHHHDDEVANAYGAVIVYIGPDGARLQEAMVKAESDSVRRKAPQEDAHMCATAGVMKSA